MEKALFFRVPNHLLIKNLGRVYWHVGGVVLALYCIITIGGFAIALLDGKPISEGIYLALITGLTIGYGDLVPLSPLSKVIAVVIGFIGIVFTGIVVAASLKALEMTIQHDKEDALGRQH